jgi:hypothetical protein
MAFCKADKGLSAASLMSLIGFWIYPGAARSINGIRMAHPITLI